MRIVLITFICILLFEPPPIGCGYFTKKVPKEAYPEQIGDFKRETPINLGGAISVSYLKESVPNSTPIRLDLFVSKDAEDAKGYLNLSTFECSDEKVESNWSIPLLNKELKDKSGKSKGIIRLCQTYYGEHKNFHLEMANDDLVMRAKTVNQASELKKANTIGLKDLVEFAENIPHNADLDFDSLKIEE